MDVPRSYLRQTLLWSLPGGEVASCSVAWDNDGGGIIGTPEDEADSLSTAATAFWGDIKAMYHSGTSFLGCRVAVMSVSHHTVETLERLTTPVTGFASANGLPHEVAMVASLRTATYSRSGRGRIYLPAPSIDTLTASGRFSSGTTDTMAEAVQALLERQTISGVEFFPVVVSQKDGALRPVTSIAVGDVPDAQRRRRDNLAEVNSVEPAI